MNEHSPPSIAELLDQDFELGLVEMCRVCDLSVERLEEWLAAGVVEPRRGGAESRFGARQLRRLRVARRLQRDLGVDSASLPLVLDLLEEVEELRRQLRLLGRLVD